MDVSATAQRLLWKAHLPRLFEEILSNPHMAIMKQPLVISMALLLEVAKRADELQDPKLCSLMMRLALFEQGDPHSSLYDPRLIDRLEAEAELCIDEGCPQHGAPHVCTPRDELAHRIETAPDEPWED